LSGFSWVSALFLMLVSCASAPLDQPPLDFSDIGANLVIDEAFSEFERFEIEAAFSEWQFATGGSFEYAARPSPDSSPWRVVRGGERLGQTIPWESTITINADGITPPDGQPFRAERFHGVVLHEMGHAAGILAHTPSIADSGGHISGTVMDEHVILDCIDAVGLEALCELRGCARMEETCR